MKIDLEQIVKNLNSMLEADEPAIRALVKNRVKCNQLLLEHPTCQCGQDDVGVLGFLNGAIGTRADGRGLIAAIVEDDSGRIQFFKVND